MTRSRSTGTRPTTSDRRSTRLPAERAFVIQLRADANLARGVVRGRVEHVLSGASAHFDSVEQLLDCIREVVNGRPEAPAQPGEAK